MLNTGIRVFSLGLEWQATCTELCHPPHRALPYYQACLDAGVLRRSRSTTRSCSFCRTMTMCRPASACAS